METRPLTWRSLLPENKPVVCLCVATTALQPEKGKCIGMWYARIADGRTESDCIVQNLNDEELALGAEYHRITPEFVRSRHIADNDEFSGRCREVLDDAVLFSFNPRFQAAWLPLPGHLYDLPLLLKGAEMRLMMEPFEVSDLEKAETAFLGRTQAPSIQNSLRWHNIITAGAEFPVEARLSGLCRLFELWKKTELLVREPLRMLS